MGFDLILSQGRVADRTPGAIKGAALTAAAIEPLIDGDRRVIGAPSPMADDDWTASLPQAHPTLAGLRDAIGRSLGNGRVPVMVANTCPASLASLPVAAAALPDVTVLWIDAHGDFNTPDTTGSGYLGGMVLSAACGLWDSGHGAGLRPGRIVVVGGRDIDAAEGELMRRHGVRVVSPAEATPERILREAGAGPVWVHVDWDALEPGFVPAAYTVPGGLTPAQVKAIFEALPPPRIAGIELAEFEAGDDEARNAQATAIILDTVAPLFAGGRQSKQESGGKA
ncbi:MAG TPA: arginase family protein [Aquamicrobium sp.]|nr:arginase family protein [Aquamicrobium sp.]